MKVGSNEYNWDQRKLHFVIFKSLTAQLCAYSIDESRLNEAIIIMNLHCFTLLLPHQGQTTRQ